VNFLEITVRKPVATPVVFVLLGVNAKIPLAILREAVLFDEPVLLLRRGLMLALHVLLVINEVTALYELLCVSICPAVQFHCHESNLRMPISQEYLI
jgi:hypothetical protein